MIRRTNNVIPSYSNKSSSSVPTDESVELGSMVIEGVNDHQHSHGGPNDQNKSSVNTSSGIERNTFEYELTHRMACIYNTIITFVWVLSYHWIYLDDRNSQLFNIFTIIYYIWLGLLTTYNLFGNWPLVNSINNNDEPFEHGIVRQLSFFLPFFKDFLFVSFSVYVESVCGYMISYLNPFKWEFERPLVDIVREMIYYFKYHEYKLFGQYDVYWTIWREWFCHKYVPTTAVMYVFWGIILIIAQDKHTKFSSFKIGQKYVRCISIVTLLRIIIFMSTIIPSSKKYCHLQKFSAVGDEYILPQPKMGEHINLKPILEDKIDSSWKVNYKPDIYHFKYDLPYSIMDKAFLEPIHKQHAFVDFHQKGGCNDLLFSGHMSIIFSTIFIFHEICNEMIKYLKKINKSQNARATVRSMSKKKGRIGNMNANNNNSNNKKIAQQRRRAMVFVAISKVCDKFFKASNIFSFMTRNVTFLIYFYQFLFYYMCWLSILASGVMIQERHHYSMDCIVAWLITWFVYRYISDKETCLYVDTKCFVNYKQWKRNAQNCKNRDILSRFLAYKVNIETLKYPIQVYIFIILFVPIFSLFVIILPGS